MAFWSKWFGGGGVSDGGKPAKSIEYKGYLIEAVPYKEGGQYQLAGKISRDGRVHNFVRADRFSDRDEAADIAITKGQLIVDQQGDHIFKQ